MIELWPWSQTVQNGGPSAAADAHTEVVQRCVATRYVYTSVPPPCGQQQQQSHMDVSTATAPHGMQMP